MIGRETHMIPAHRRKTEVHICSKRAEERGQNHSTAVSLRDEQVGTQLDQPIRFNFQLDQTSLSCYPTSGSS